MNQSAIRYLRTPMFLVGGLSIVFGGLATYDMWLSSKTRFLPPDFQYVMFLGPLIISLGVLTCLCAFSFSASSIFRRSILGLGLLLLLAGGFPWIYSHYLSGGRAGNEGAGMLATMIFLFIGLPGLAATLAGWLLHLMNRKKDL